MKKEKLRKEQILDLLPTRTSLIYVDYNDNLDEQAEVIQQCIRDGNFDSLYEKVDEWYLGSQFDGLSYILKELKEDIESTFEIEDAADLIEQYEDEIKDEIYNRCTDDTANELMNNTKDFVCHYNTEYEVESGSWNWSSAEIRLERIKIKKFLQITSSVYDSSIDMMIIQASYGGTLLIYFNAKEINNLVLCDGAKSVKFSDAHIGIVNHWNGSGDVTDLPKHEFILPFDKRNVFLEESVRYNWTYAIAGMVRDWCESTEFELLTNDNLK